MLRIHPVVFCLFFFFFSPRRKNLERCRCEGFRVPGDASNHEIMNVIRSTSPDFLFSSSSVYVCSEFSSSDFGETLSIIPTGLFDFGEKIICCVISVCLLRHSLIVTKVTLKFCNATVSGFSL